MTDIMKKLHQEAADFQRVLDKLLAQTPPNEAAIQRYTQELANIRQEIADLEQVLAEVA